MIVKKILVILWAVVWRLALTAALLAGLVILGANMVLSTILNGPSVTARNELVMTLLENESTAHLPGRFLDEATVAGICGNADVLPAQNSDPGMVTPQIGTASSHAVTVDGRSANVSISYTDTLLPQSGGSYRADFDENGILLLSINPDAPLSGCCEKILIMNGQINSGIYEGNTGYAPRYAIGQCADGAIVRLTMEYGTYQDLVDIMTEYGAVNACLLSGNEE